MTEIGRTPQKIPAVAFLAAPSFLEVTLARYEARYGSRERITLDVRGAAALHGLLRDGEIPPSVAAQLAHILNAGLLLSIPGWRIERDELARKLKIHCYRDAPAAQQPAVAS